MIETGSLCHEGFWRDCSDGYVISNPVDCCTYSQRNRLEKANRIHLQVRQERRQDGSLVGSTGEEELDHSCRYHTWSGF